MIEKLCLCHPHIALSLFSQEKDLNLWALWESWQLKAHSHIHSLCPVGNLSRTSPSASLPSSKASHCLWSHFSEGSGRLVTLRPAPPLCALHHSRNPHALRRSFQAAHLLPAEQGLVQWGAAGTDLVPFPGWQCPDQHCPTIGFPGLARAASAAPRPCPGSCYVHPDCPLPSPHSLFPECSELPCGTISALRVGVAAYQAGGFGFYTGIGGRFWSKLQHFLARKPRQHMAQCSQFKSDT